MSYAKELDRAESLNEIFDLVKIIVKDFTGRERSGLMLGLAELGGNPGAFVGAFYPVGSNIIVLNKTPLRVIESSKPELYKYYCFSIILHEYLHTIGILDEKANRIATYIISKKAFGENHPVTTIVTDLAKLFPEIIYASLFWRPAEKLQIEIVEDFGSDLNYIG